MAELEKKPVKIVETILRDAHQSQMLLADNNELRLPLAQPQSPRRCRRYKSFDA